MKQKPNPFPHSPGVYRIVQVRTGRSYVGATDDLSDRWAKHRNDSRKPRPRTEVGRLIRRCGVGAFRFEVLEECTVDRLNHLEIRWWLKLKPSINRVPPTYKTPRVKFPSIYRIMDRARRKLAERSARMSESVSVA